MAIPTSIMIPRITICMSLFLMSTFDNPFILCSMFWVVYRLKDGGLKKDIFTKRLAKPTSVK
jgi:hypothetical protein